MSMLIKVLKYFLIAIIGCGLSLLYSYILNGGINTETVIVFFILYCYIVFFIKFLIKLFK